MLRAAKAKFLPQGLRLRWMHLPRQLAKFARVAVAGIRTGTTVGDVLRETVLRETERQEIVLRETGLRATGLRVVIAGLPLAVTAALLPAGIEERRQTVIGVATRIVVVAVADAAGDVAGACRIPSMPPVRVVARPAMPPR